MAAGNGVSLAKKMWDAANSDVAHGNESDRLTFCVGYLASELEKRDKVIAELRQQLAALVGDGR
jgi:hypothetical protein